MTKQWDNWGEREKDRTKREREREKELAMKTGTERKKRATILQMRARLQRKKVGRTCFAGAA